MIWKMKDGSEKNIIDLSDDELVSAFQVCQNRVISKHNLARQYYVAKEWLRLMTIYHASDYTSYAKFVGDLQKACKDYKTLKEANYKIDLPVKNLNIAPPMTLFKNKTFLYKQPFNVDNVEEFTSKYEITEKLYISNSHGITEDDYLTIITSQSERYSDLTPTETRVFSSCLEYWIPAINIQLQDWSKRAIQLEQELNKRGLTYPKLPNYKAAVIVIA